MIVVDREDGTLLVVRQTDHARMSGRIAAAWQPPPPEEPPETPLPGGCGGVVRHHGREGPLTEVAARDWQRFVDAVGHHDDGWAEPDLTPTIDAQGRPYDFKSIPTARHVAVWRRSVELARRLHPYTGLLVALHARGLYTLNAKARPDDPAAGQAFLGELNEHIDAEIERFRQDGHASLVAPQALDHHRRLLGFLDGLTLAMAGAIPWPGEVGPFHFADQHARLRVEHREQTVTIDPWPFHFDAQAFSVSMPAATVAPARFESDDEARRAIEAATPLPIRWTIRRA